MKSLDWPSELPGNLKPAPWLNKLRKATLSSHLKDVVGVGSVTAKLIPANDGQTLVVSGNPSAAPASNLFPFAIYQPPLTALQNQSGSPNTGVIFDVNANPSKINIDSTVPTDFSANPPTVNPNTDYWRFWLVRDGQVEIRPYYSIVGGDVSSNNFSKQQDVRWGTDSVTPQPGNDLIPPIGQVNKNTIASYNSSDTTSGVGNFTFFTNGMTAPNHYPDSTVYTGLIVINGDFDGFEQIAFSLWIEITPDTNTTQIPLTRIKGFRISGDIGGFSNNVVPAKSPFIIPIGQITNVGQEGNYIFTVTQGLSGHCFNRWPASMCVNGKPPTQANLYSTNVYGAMSYRGSWTKDDIQDQVFYPGDFVYFDNKDMPPIFEASAGYPLSTAEICICKAVCFTSDPSTDGNFDHRFIGFINE